MLLTALLSTGRFSACKSGPGGSGSSGDGDGGFVEDQPEYPAAGDDPFFFEEAPARDTAFRVLIRRGNYQVRQIGMRDVIARREDPIGDKEQMEFFIVRLLEFLFVNMKRTGRINIRLSPLSGQIEHIAYVNGETPRTWQASKYFQDDVSRFRFYAPRGGMPARRFEVQYLWRVDKRTGISDEETRQRAVEWLKQQTKR